MPDAVDLGFALRLPPRDAIAYLKAKGYAITWNWWELWQEAQARAFTVAKAASADLLADIRAEMERVLEEGITEREFIRALEPRLKARGWWGRVVVVDPDGGAERVQLGSPHRLRTIYRTNAQTAFQAGRCRAQDENRAARPYWQYVAVMDSRTRPSHAALHGKVFGADDPIWQTVYPPNGFNCRCRVRALTAEQIQAMGLTVESSEGQLSTETVEAGLDKHTGEVIEREVTVWHGTDRVGRPAVFRTDPGWAYNPGLAAFGGH